MTPSLDREIAAVLRARACSGCGACALLDDGLEMLDDGGFRRPHRTTPSTASAAQDRENARRFRAACPGVEVRSPRPDGGVVDPVLGPVLGAWEAWAADPEARFRGSSGGVLTALAAWLAENGEAAQVVGARAADPDPRRTVTVRIQSREEALASAGSRYAPVSTAASPDALDPHGAVVGKPCEVSALRTLAGPDAPLLLSFFCAGTPNQAATDRLVEELGLPADAPPDTLRYRGHGWPGDFVARADGREVRTDYDTSWGRHLGPTVQWRCKICPDGVGESSDVTAGDFWRTDDRGYPVFTEGDGVSALLARTPRGLDVVRRAIAAGVLEARPVDVREVAAVQPFQRRRRATLLGRLVGARLAGRRVPRYRGFGLLRQALADPRATVRTARGSFERVRRA